MNQGSGDVIFVDLGTKTGKPVTTNIMLSQSAYGTFAVLDKNGTDGQAAFQLRAPGTYTIWARAGHARRLEQDDDVCYRSAGPHSDHLLDHQSGVRPRDRKFEVHRRHHAIDQSRCPRPTRP